MVAGVSLGGPVTVCGLALVDSRVTYSVLEAKKGGSMEASKSLGCAWQKLPIAPRVLAYVQRPIKYGHSPRVSCWGSNQGLQVTVPMNLRSGRSSPISRVPSYRDFLRRRMSALQHNLSSRSFEQHSSNTYQMFDVEPFGECNSHFLSFTRHPRESGASLRQMTRCSSSNEQ
jgi:hypothetical protein